MSLVFAHGVGGAQDLPIPAEFAIAGATAALAVSFIVLALAWRTPRYDAATSGRPAPRWLQTLVDAPAFTITLRILGLAFFLYVAWAALAGPDLLINPAFGTVYVLLWVGLVPASLLFGPFYRAVNPVRTLNLVFGRLVGGDPRRGMYRLPGWVGYWPAALGRRHIGPATSHCVGATAPRGSGLGRGRPRRVRPALLRAVEP